ncbi:MAG: hypothetical protein UW09_C0001G0072 [candidate division TM6 bacterium GW2011_GWF2_43_87]|nr:MAG: hypothetical protein UW09_C0001G0072 [candidate division TM6 bacterium GW2011_GWF2_43_87]
MWRDFFKKVSPLWLNQKRKTFLVRNRVMGPSSRRSYGNGCEVRVELWRTGGLCNRSRTKSLWGVGAKSHSIPTPLLKIIEAHDAADLLHGMSGYGAGVVGAFFDGMHDGGDVLLEFFASCADGC